MPGFRGLASLLTSLGFGSSATRLQFTELKYLPAEIDRVAELLAPAERAEFKFAAERVALNIEAPLQFYENKSPAVVEALHGQTPAAIVATYRAYSEEVKEILEGMAESRASVQAGARFFNTLHDLERVPGHHHNDALVRAIGNVMNVGAERFELGKERFDWMTEQLLKPEEQLIAEFGPNSPHARKP